MQYQTETNIHNQETSHPATGLDEFSTIEQLATNNPQLITVNRLRWILRDRQTNGLAPAVKKLGKKLVVHIPTFVAWIMQQRG